MEQYARIDSSYYDNYTFGLTGDVKFYVEEAQRSPGRVLELACGTGRVTIPLALAGIDVVGIDLSEPMLDIAREKLAELGEDVRNRVQLVHGDMRSFFVDTPDGEKFSVAMIPYRSFCHILTPEDQSRVLARMCDHLADDGRLIINIFDPKLDWILEDSSFPESPLRKHHEFTNPATGNRVVIWDTRKYDLEAQVIDEDRIFEEIDRDGVVIREATPSGRCGGRTGTRWSTCLGLADSRSRRCMATSIAVLFITAASRSGLRGRHRLAAWLTR